MGPGEDGGKPAAKRSAGPLDRLLRAIANENERMALRKRRQDDARAAAAKDKAQNKSAKRRDKDKAYWSKVKEREAQVRALPRPRALPTGKPAPVDRSAGPPAGADTAPARVQGPHAVPLLRTRHVHQGRPLPVPPQRERQARSTVTGCAPADEPVVGKGQHATGASRGGAVPPRATRTRRGTAAATPAAVIGRRGASAWSFSATRAPCPCPRASPAQSPASAGRAAWRSRKI